MRILVVKLSSLGDVLHALPAVHELQVQLNATVDWVTQPEYVDLVRACPDVSRVIPFPRRNFPSKAGGFLKELRRESYDLAVDLQGLLKSAFVVRASRAKLRVGPRFHREGANLLYTRVVGQPRQDRHAVDALLDEVGDLLPDSIGIPSFPLVIPESKLKIDRPIVAVAPFSRWPAKNWPITRFADVARQLTQSDNASVVLVGGPSDRTPADQIREAVGNNVLNMAGQTSLVELAGVLKQADLLITNDSGPMHLAAAVGLPALALFGPTDPRRTGPYGDIHRVLLADCACRPCFRRECPRKRECMREITVEMVLDGARQMLAHCSLSNASSADKEPETQTAVEQNP